MDNFPLPAGGQRQHYLEVSARRLHLNSTSMSCKHSSSINSRICSTNICIIFKMLVNLNRLDQTYPSNDGMEGIFSVHNAQCSAAQAGPPEVISIESHASDGDVCASQRRAGPGPLAGGPSLGPRRRRLGHAGTAR